MRKTGFTLEKKSWICRKTGFIQKNRIYFQKILEKQDLFKKQVFYFLNFFKPKEKKKTGFRPTPSYLQSPNSKWSPTLCRVLLPSTALVMAISTLLPKNWAIWLLALISVKTCCTLAAWNGEKYNFHLNFRINDDLKHTKFESIFNYTHYRAASGSPRSPFWFEKAFKEGNFSKIFFNLSKFYFIFF